MSFSWSPVSLPQALMNFPSFLISTPFRTPWFLWFGSSQVCLVPRIYKFVLLIAVFSHPAPTFNFWNAEACPKAANGDAPTFRHVFSLPPRFSYLVIFLSYKIFRFVVYQAKLKNFQSLSWRSCYFDSNFLCADLRLRHRFTMCSLKVSQSDYFRQNCIHLLSTVLTRLTDLNDANPDALCNPTRFHSIAKPDISLKKYMKRVLRYTDCELETLVCGVVYALRFAKKSDCIITSYNVHRIVLTSIVIAMKYVEDACYTNKYMAKVGGLSLPELNRLELMFLTTLDFSLDVSAENFEQFCSEVCRLDALIMMEEINTILPRLQTKPMPNYSSKCGKATEEGMILMVGTGLRRSCSLDEVMTQRQAVCS